MSRLRSKCFAVAAVTAMVACGEDVPAGPTETVELIEVTPQTVTFSAFGEQQALLATAKDASGNNISGVAFMWTSSDTSIARVAETGVVWGVGNGTATIDASVATNSSVGQGSAATGSASVTVQQIPVGLAIDAPAVNLLEGDTMRLGAWEADANGHQIGASTVDPGALQWSTSDTTVATIDATGLLMGVAMGPVTIRVSSSGTPKSAAFSTFESSDSDSTNVDVLVTFTALDMGAYHSCGLTAANRIYCWGSNGEGRLGSISASDSSQRDRHYPVRGGHEYQLVSAGDAHTCAIEAHGETYCWGNNTEGQLGIGTSDWDQNYDPSPVSGGLRFTAIDLGWRHTCGITEAGALFCWGSGTSGTLGTGNTDSVLSPTPALGGIRFEHLALGEDHGCGIADDGLVYCWGDNSSGQLGHVSGETCVDVFMDTTDCSTTPTLVTDSIQFASVSASRSHTCALGVDERVYCWGDGLDGRLGAGDSLPRAQPTLVAGNLTFESISAGIAHTCGVSTDGFVYCWGSNIVGQIGDGTRTDRLTPVRSDLEAPVKQVSCGASHTCGLTGDDVAYCWGHGFQGQLGNGQTDGTTVPVLVLGQR